jgi:hypothetical protein
MLTNYFLEMSYANIELNFPKVLTLTLCHSVIYNQRLTMLTKLMPAEY